MEKKITFEGYNQKIIFSDLDQDTECQITMCSLDNEYENTYYLNKEEIISLQKHVNYLASKILNEEAVSEDGFCTNSICTFNEKNTCYFVTRLKKCNDRKNNSA